MQRDLAKTTTFAVLHFAVGFGVSYAFTGSVAIASGIALVEPLVNTVVFFFHERAWRRGGQRRHDDHDALPGGSSLDPSASRAGLPAAVG